jgi:hypothetical protein
MCIVQRRDGSQPANFDCARGGCPVCLETLLLKHKGLIYVVVRRQYPGRCDYADLIQT